ncbi:hypothetical protein ACHQM5_004170 [Ranunculus cassubicifolius]
MEDQEMVAALGGGVEGEGFVGQQQGQQEQVEDPVEDNPLDPNDPVVELLPVTQVYEDLMPAVFDTQYDLNANHVVLSGPGRLPTHLSFRRGVTFRSSGRFTFQNISIWWHRIRSEPRLVHLRNYLLATPFRFIIDCKYRTADRQLHRALGERW